MTMGSAPRAPHISAHDSTATPYSYRLNSNRISGLAAAPAPRFAVQASRSAGLGVPDTRPRRLSPPVTVASAAPVRSAQSPRNRLEPHGARCDPSLCARTRHHIQRARNPHTWVPLRSRSMALRPQPHWGVALAHQATATPTLPPPAAHCAARRPSDHRQPLQFHRHSCAPWPFNCGGHCGSHCRRRSGTRNPSANSHLQAALRPRLIFSPNTIASNLSRFARTRAEGLVS